MPARPTTIAEGPHPVDLHVGRRVGEKRVLLGLNQRDLAKALGLTFQQIQKYETGANRISASRLWEIARVLKVDISYFFVGLNEQGEPIVDPSAEATWPATRATLELARLAPQLPPVQQRLLVEMAHHLLDPLTTSETTKVA